jgi:hypothetical protein
MTSRLSDDAGSLPLALLLTLVSVSISAALVPVVASQVGSTRSTVNRTHALHAAQTGLEIAAAALRAAHAPNSGQGDRALLPCGPIAGTAGIEAAASYEVRLAYYHEAPNAAGASVLSCAQARGGSVAPRFVLLTATGTTTSPTPIRRALRATYPLQVAAPDPSPTWSPSVDDRVQPRAILAWGAVRGRAALCLDPGSGEPKADTKVKLQVCDSDKHPDNGYRQNWYYRPDLSVATVGSILNDAPMCLDAGAAPTAGAALTVQQCVTPIPARQRWYYNAFRNFELAVSTGPGPADVALSGLCLNVDQPDKAGSSIVIGAGANCHSASFSSRQTFSAYATVGPGQAASRPLDCTAAAGYPCVLTQLLNRGASTRCLDLYTAFLAALECVQDPNPSKIRWNQLWRLPKAPDGPVGGAGPIVTVDPDGNTFCLTTSSSYLPLQKSCDPTAPALSQKFTIYGNTGNEYTMYRIVDSQGRCLAETMDGSPGPYGKFWWNQASWHWKAHVEPCVNTRNDPRAEDGFNVGSVLLFQKWNAPFQLPTDTSPVTPMPAPLPTPNTTNPLPLENLSEIQPGS